MTLIPSLLAGFTSVALAACVSSMKATPPRAPNVAALELPEILRRGDTMALYRVLRAELESVGARLPPTMTFRTQPTSDLLSAFNYGDYSLRLSSLPSQGGGLPYWRAWSKAIAGGKWQSSGAFKDEADAHAVAGYAILGILAHELGHAIADYANVNPSELHAQELLADRIAVGVMLELDRVPRLAHLRARYRAVALGALLDAIPAAPRIPASDLDAWVSATPASPGDLPRYVSLQLARQRRLFADAEAGFKAGLAQTLERFIDLPARAHAARIEWDSRAVTSSTKALARPFARDDHPFDGIRDPGVCPCWPNQLVGYDGRGRPVVLRIEAGSVSVVRLGAQGEERVGRGSLPAWLREPAFDGAWQIRNAAFGKAGDLWLIVDAGRTLRLNHVRFAERGASLRTVATLGTGKLDALLALTETDRPVVALRTDDKTGGISRFTVRWLDAVSGASLRERTFALKKVEHPADGALVDGVGEGDFGSFAADDLGTIWFSDYARRGVRALRGDRLLGFASYRKGHRDAARPDEIEMTFPSHLRIVEGGRIVFTESFRTGYVTRALTAAPR